MTVTTTNKKSDSPQHFLCYRSFQPTYLMVACIEGVLFATGLICITSIIVFGLT